MRAGRSRVLLLRGEAGVGRTALLNYVAAAAAGCRIARVAGLESEMELPFAGLQRLCAPMLDGLERLQTAQRDALAVSFGIQAGEAPDRFLVGLAVRSLLADAACDGAVVCIIDDVQWLDRVSAQMLAFAARRVSAEAVGLIFAIRGFDDDHDLTGIPELAVRGLAEDDARALLASVVAGPLDERVRDRIVAETRGNPRALLELPREVTPEALAGGFGLPDTPALSARIEESFRRRLRSLPAATRRLLLLAAAEPLGDPVLLWRAASDLGVDVQAAGPAADVGLVDFGATIRFHHPLARSAVYRAGSPKERAMVHRALADATDADSDPDRRAWHRAQATVGLDEEVAGELERSADRARARGGLAAAAAFLQRAAALTPLPARRARRAFAAAQAKHLAGAPDAALGLLAVAEAGPLDALERARAELLRGQIAFVVTCGRDAPSLLLQAAKRLESLDPALARETYLDALSAALFAGQLSATVRKISEAVRDADWSASSEHSPRPCDLLLEGLAALATQGYAAGAPALKLALSRFRDDATPEDQALRWSWLVCHVARALGDDQAWDDLTNRHVRLARDAGALSLLPILLDERFKVELYAGSLVAARSLAAEMDSTADAIGSRLTPHGAYALAAWRGDESQAGPLIEGDRQDAARRGEGVWLIGAEWTRAELLNGLGSWEEALAAAEWVAGQPDELGSSTWVASELIEAAVRSGDANRGEGALQRLAEMAAATGTDWALAMEARSRALLSEGETADRLYREAIERLERTRIRVALARTHLVYGEWLRRENRRLEARTQLRVAHDLLEAMGARGFAERARRELRATGETARRRTDDSRGDLTAQEAQIARLAADGCTNPEIGARLYLSPRTVEWHLRKVYPKLGVNGRKGLRAVLGAVGSALVAA